MEDRETRRGADGRRAGTGKARKLANREREKHRPWVAKERRQRSLRALGVAPPEDGGMRELKLFAEPNPPLVGQEGRRKGAMP